MQKKSKTRIIIGALISLAIVIVAIALEDFVIVATELGSINPTTIQAIETTLVIIIGLTISSMTMTLVLFTIIKTVE
jgi:hypothetical protein